MSNSLRRMIGWVGHRGREALLLPQVLQAQVLQTQVLQTQVLRPFVSRNSKPRVAFLPSEAGLGAGDLRALGIARALRAQGWEAMALPAQLELVQRARLLRLYRPDILVFQKCRHRLNRADLAFGFPFVLDLDDADFCDPAQAPHLEEMARRARGVLAGSRHVQAWAQAFNPHSHVVWTGTPISRGPRPAQETRAPIVTWAQSAPLGYPDELAFVETVLRRLHDKGPGLRLRLYGVNDAKARAELAARFDFLQLETRPTLSYDAFLTSLRETALGLSPIIPASPFSRGKSFGKILGYLDAKVPVICSDEADHALFFTAQSGVVSNDPDLWVAAARDLLQDPARREAMAEAGFAALHERLSLEATARRVGDLLVQMV